MNRWWVFLVALLGCEAGVPAGGDAGESGGQAVGALEQPADPGSARAILAVDLEPLSAPLREAGRLPTAVDVVLDGAAAASATLPAPSGLLEGHLALPLIVGQPTELVVRATYADGTVEATAPRTVQAAEDEIVRVPVLLDAHRALAVGAEARVTLPLGTRLAVERLGHDAEVREARAAAIALLLSEPAVSAVTPFTEAPSAADEVGALIPGERPTPGAAATARPSTAAAPTVKQVASSTAPSAPTRASRPTGQRDEATPRITSWRLLRVTMGAAPRTAGELLSYYSYCSCGRPAPDRPYTLTLPDGRSLRGTSDPYGFVVVARGGAGSLDFGPTQRPRPRAYAFEPGDPALHATMLAALSSNDTNTVLTALLDLRDEPLAEATETLVTLLDSPEVSLRLNAALALVATPGVDLGSLVRRRLATLDDDPLAALPVLGALRQPAALDAVLLRLDADDAAVRAAAAWALGLIGDPRAIGPLEWALSDPDSAVRAQAALAVGRIGSYGSLDALEGMLVDTSDDVVGRVREAIALATF